MRNVLALFFIAFLAMISARLYGQDSTSIPHLPSKYINEVSSKAAAMEQKLDKQSEKVLRKMQKEEDRLRKKIAKIDSNAAKAIFGDAKEKYDQLSQKLNNPGQLKQYIPYLDTLNTSLKFLEENKELLNQAKGIKTKLDGALSNLKGMESQFQKAAELKQFLKERRQYLKDQLSKFGFAKQLKKINREVYYYGQQINEYKELIKDRKKAEKKAIELLTNSKPFKEFMKKNSILASLFRLPGSSDPNDPAYLASLSGLQTRAQVNQLIQTQAAAGGATGAQTIRENIQAGQAELNQLKEKLNQFGGNSGDGDMEMPDFKPNTQKTKSFLKRLEYGTNLQTQKASYFFPTTSDIGLSVGYKLNDKSIIGVGASYKVGLGNGWNNIEVSHQGVGLRSFVDMKLKGSFWISGGYEMNYRSEFQNYSQLQNMNAWQTSGLLGLSKKYKISKKFKGNLQLLWDFMSYQQVPRTQPILFRMGYTL